MTTKEQIIQEIEQIPEPLLEEVLNYVRSLKLELQQKTPSKAFQAFLKSLEERKEVYRRERKSKVQNIAWLL